MNINVDGKTGMIALITCKIDSRFLSKVVYQQTYDPSVDVVMAILPETSRQGSNEFGIRYS